MTFAAALTVAKTRILAMELLAIPASKAAESYASFKYISGFPYWTNRISDVQFPPERGEDFFKYTVPYVARLIVGYSGGGWKGEHEDTLQYTYIPNVLTYFNTRPRLVYEAGQVSPKYFDVHSFAIRSTGLQLFTLPDGSFYVGTEFPMNLVFTVYMEME